MATPTGKVCYKGSFDFAAIHCACQIIQTPVSGRGTRQLTVNRIQIVLQPDIMHSLTLCVFATVALASPVRRGHGHGSWPHNGAANAAYFLDNDPSGSSIVSLQIANNGQLSDPVRTSTDGYGAIGTNLTGFPNAVDTLMSQSAVVVSGNVSSSVDGR